jgi:hypothetical protein
MEGLNIETILKYLIIVALSAVACFIFANVVVYLLQRRKERSSWSSRIKSISSKSDMESHRQISMPYPIRHHQTSPLTMSSSQITPEPEEIKGTDSSGVIKNYSGRQEASLRQSSSDGNKSVAERPRKRQEPWPGLGERWLMDEKLKATRVELQVPGSRVGGGTVSNTSPPGALSAISGVEGKQAAAPSPSRATGYEPALLHLKTEMGQVATTLRSLQESQQRAIQELREHREQVLEPPLNNLSKRLEQCWEDLKRKLVELEERLSKLEGVSGFGEISKGED